MKETKSTIGSFTIDGNYLKLRKYQVLVKRGRLGGIYEMPLLPLQGQSVSGRYIVRKYHHNNIV
jgi:hypothetical protein